MKRIIALVVLITVLGAGMARPVNAGGAPFQWFKFVNADGQNCGAWQAGGQSGGTTTPGWLAMYAVTDGLGTVISQGTLTDLKADPIMGNFNPLPRQNPLHFVAVAYYQGTIGKLGDLSADDPCLPASLPGPTLPPTVGPVNPPSPSTSVAVRRLQFQPNAVSGSVQGQLTPLSIDEWVVGAQAGQTMSVRLIPAYGQGFVFVYGADGSVLQTPQQVAGSFQGVLPSTQDYYVNVEASSFGNFGYTLNVTIPPR